MKNQNQDISHKMNKATVISLVAGIIALVPYLVWMFAYLLISNDITETIGTILFAIMVIGIPFIFHFIDGIVFGLISLISGIISIKQIKNNQSPQTSFRLASVGIVLGVLGMAANVIFVYLVFLGLMMRD